MATPTDRITTLAQAALLAAAVCAVGEAIASPIVPLRNVSLSSQEDPRNGCAFVGQRLYCWGRNIDGQLGIGTASVT